MLYYRTNNETNLILLSILEKSALNSLCLLNNYEIYGNNGGYIIRYYIYTWLLINILD
jgi:hypothetical protein